MAKENLPWQKPWKSLKQFSVRWRLPYTSGGPTSLCSAKKSPGWSVWTDIPYAEVLALNKEVWEGFQQQNHASVGPSGHNYFRLYQTHSTKALEETRQDSPTSVPSTLSSPICGHSHSMTVDKSMKPLVSILSKVERREREDRQTANNVTNKVTQNF